MLLVLTLFFPRFVFVMLMFGDTHVRSKGRKSHACKLENCLIVRVSKVTETGSSVEGSDTFSLSTMKSDDENEALRSIVHIVERPVPLRSSELRNFFNDVR